MQKLGIKHQMTTAFHPQSNGLGERAHRRLKESLKAQLAGPDWPAHLP
jgi:transposase InsO family protein